MDVIEDVDFVEYYDFLEFVEWFIVFFYVRRCCRGYYFVRK